MIIELGTKCNIKGKAGNLNRLYDDFNIARGFIISDDSFKNFLKHNNITLDKKNDSVENITEKILRGELKEEKEIIECFKKNGFDKVIVRSSVSLEDTLSHTFAGQFDSFLDTTIDNLIMNIKKCWASLFSENVEHYIKSKKIKSSDISFNILIQEMIESDIGGVAFSLNPTNSKNEILIEAVKGRCSSLVDGTTSPHTYHIQDELKGDELLNEEKLFDIKDNLERLKMIYSKEIEIEFCFKKNQFYLLQVRPITKIHFSICSYIDEEYWCCFKNNNRTLLMRSLWILGACKYKHNSINNEVTEDITIYYPYNLKQVRGFNGNQPPLDEVTIKRHKDEDIIRYIEEYYQIERKAEESSKLIESDIASKNYESFLRNLKKLINHTAQVNSYEYLIGSLAQSKHDILISEVLKKVEKWRNDEQKNSLKIFDEISKYIIDRHHLQINVKKFVLYIHIDELLNVCEGKLKPETLLRRIHNREKNGFVLLNVQNKKYNNKIISKSEEIKRIKKRLENLQNGILEDDSIGGIKGTSTFKDGRVIEGECIVIKDNNLKIEELNIDNKILVCPVTTAKDVKYLKNIKALIVDSGGILCHSAIFSREFSIPCLMGCEVATSYFETGDIIKYDLDNEIVIKM